MSLRRNNNLTTVLLNDESPKTAAALPSVGTVVTRANVAKGAVVVTDLGLRRLDFAAYTALPNDAQFFIIQGKGPDKPFLKSPVLTKGKVSFSTSKHKPTQKQISTIGFNGINFLGSLPFADNTSYWLKIRKNDNDAANRSQPESLYAQFKTGTGATQASLAFGLVANGVKNVSLQPANGYVNIDVLADNAVDIGAGATGAITVAYGSRNVKFATAVDAVASVGDYIRLDESVGAAPGNTDPIYKIVAMDTVNEIATLDRPYSGTSMTAAAAGNAFLILAANINGPVFGIRIQGAQANFDVNAFRDFYANRFTVSFSDEAALNTHVQGAFNGNGVWQQVAMDEYMTYGFEGQNEMLGVPPVPRDQEVKIPGVRSNTLATSRYSALQINWTEDIRGLVTVGGGQGSVLVYLNLGGGGTIDATLNTGLELITVFGIAAASVNP